MEDLTSSQRSQLSEVSDLLTPTLQGETLTYREQPWNLGAQFWIAFLGGPLAVTIIAWRNGQRLLLPRRTLNLILVFGLLATAAAVGVVWWGSEQWVSNLSQISRLVRTVNRVVGVLLFLLLLRRLQEAADRRYQAIQGDQYASLWKPGALAVVGGGIGLALLELLVTGTLAF